MIKIRKSILSVLMFSFVFLVVHDYVAQQTSELITCENCLITGNSLTELDSQAVMDSQLHENIHNLLKVETDIPLDNFIFADTQPAYTKLDFTSKISFILERPPLFS